MDGNDLSRVVEDEDEKAIELKRNRSPIVIFYKQKRIIYIDFSELRNADEIFAFAEKSSSLFRQNLPKSVLVLANVSGMSFNRDIYSRLMAYMKNNDPYLKACAVVGMSGLMQVLYTAVAKFSGRNLKPFANEAEAKEYLAAM